MLLHAHICSHMSTNRLIAIKFEWADVSENNQFTKVPGLPFFIPNLLQIPPRIICILLFREWLDC